MPRQKRKTLTDKQLKAIEAIVEGEMTVTEILKKYDIPKTTFYGWYKQKPFTDKLNELLEYNDKLIDQRLKARVNKYINRLEAIAFSGKNENAATASLKELMELAGKHKSPEITIVNKNESEEKNYLLDMLNQDDDEDQDSTVH
jgi:hypothetical protein